MACKIVKNDQENSEDTIILWVNGSPMREFIFTDDLADAIVFSLARGFNLPGNLINKGSSFEISISALADLNKAAFGFKEETRWHRCNPRVSRRKPLDNSVFQNLGWPLKTDMKSKIKSSYEWYLANRSRLVS